MKKILVSVMILLFCAVIALSGCGSSNNSTPTQPATVIAAETESGGYDMTSPKSAEWFDNAVFVGDSVTLKLDYYCEDHPDALGKASFYCAGSLGYTNALWDINDSEAVHPYYEGANHLVEDCVAVTGKNNVFIMLGMNDIGLYGTEGAMKSCKTVVENLLNKSPGAHIYLQSVTPMVESAQLESFNNTLIKEFNGMLKTYCEENGYHYLDVYSAFADEKGNLPKNLCSDPDGMGLHFTDSACKMWADYLKNNA